MIWLGQLACSSARAEDLWDFIKVGRDMKGAPAWEARAGKARVRMSKDSIRIEAYFKEDSKNGAGVEYFGDYDAKILVGTSDRVVCLASLK